MDIQLKDLIEKIKSEGVVEGEEKARQIIENAEKEAASIIQKAEKESNKIISNAKHEADQFQKAAKEILKHSSRDLILNIKESLIKLFDSIIKDEVNNAFSDKIIEEIIPIIARDWINNNLSGIDIQLSEEDYKRLKDKLLGMMSKKIKNGIVFKANPFVARGFRIGEKDGNAYYDLQMKG